MDLEKTLKFVGVVVTLAHACRRSLAESWGAFLIGGIEDGGTGLA